MKWINIKDNLPELCQLVLVYRCEDKGGYYRGVYIATYEKLYKSNYIFIIEDRETNHNNYRPLSEFSHWMPLPDKPDLKGNNCAEKNSTIP